MKMSKYFYAGTLLIAFIAILIVGCVKIPSEAPPLPEFKASVRFMNTLVGGDPVAVSVDGTLKATLASGEASDYMEVIAGNRVITVDDVVDTNFIETDFKGTVFIAEDGLILNRERWTHTNTQLADTVTFVVIAQMALDTLHVGVFDTSGTGTGFESMAQGDFEKVYLVPGEYTILVETPTDTLWVDETLAAQDKSTIVILGASGNLSVEKIQNE